MKRIAAFVMVLVLVLAPFHLGWRLRVNSERVTWFNIKPYRSWSVSYSDGMTWLPDGRTKNLWRAPRFHHLDMRTYLTLGTNGQPVPLVLPNS